LKSVEAGIDARPEHGVGLASPGIPITQRVWLAEITALPERAFIILAAWSTDRLLYLSEVVLHGFPGRRSRLVERAAEAQA
jgi:hypothetical protein